MEKRGEKIIIGGVIAILLSGIALFLLNYSEADSLFLGLLGWILFRVNTTYDDEYKIKKIKEKN